MAEKRKTTPSLQMADGREVRFLELDDDQIKLVDIALGLSRENRYVGQTLPDSNPYNVAHHSVLVSLLVEQMAGSSLDITKAAFLHDSAEYITGDMPSPVKTLLKPRISEIERRITIPIFRKFGVSLASHDDPIHDIVHQADSMMYVAEVHDICHPGTRDWHDVGPRPSYDLIPKVVPFDEQTSFELFMDRFIELWVDEPWLMTA